VSFFPWYQPFSLLTVRSRTFIPLFQFFVPHGSHVRAGRLWRRSRFGLTARLRLYVPDPSSPPRSLGFTFVASARHGFGGLPSLESSHVRHSRRLRPFMTWRRFGVSSVGAPLRVARGQPAFLLRRFKYTSTFAVRVVPGSGSGRSAIASSAVSPSGHEFHGSDSYAPTAIGSPHASTRTATASASGIVVLRSRST